MSFIAMLFLMKIAGGAASIIVTVILTFRILRKIGPIKTHCVEVRDTAALPPVADTDAGASKKDNSGS